MCRYLLHDGPIMGYGHTRFSLSRCPSQEVPNGTVDTRLSRCRKPIGSIHHRLYKPISSPCTNAWPNSRNKSTNSKSDCNARPRHPTNHPRRIHPSKDLSASKTSPQANGAHEWAILGQAPGCSVPPSGGPSIPDLVPAARAHLARRRRITSIRACPGLDLGADAPPVSCQHHVQSSDARHARECSA